MPRPDRLGRPFRLLGKPQELIAHRRFVLPKLSLPDRARAKRPLARPQELEGIDDVGKALRPERDVVVDDVEVQVRPPGVAGVANLTEYIASANPLTDPNAGAPG